jgi:hypothetical protein
MTDARLQLELHENKAELQRLKNRITAGTHAVQKDLSDAIRIALAVEETESFERFTESFFASFKGSLNAHSPRTPSREVQRRCGTADRAYAARNRHHQHSRTRDVTA